MVKESGICGDFGMCYGCNPCWLGNEALVFGALWSILSDASGPAHGRGRVDLVFTANCI